MLWHRQDEEMVQGEWLCVLGAAISCLVSRGLAVVSLWAVPTPADSGSRSSQVSWLSVQESVCPDFTIGS